MSFLSNSYFCTLQFIKATPPFLIEFSKNDFYVGAKFKVCQKMHRPRTQLTFKTRLSLRALRQNEGQNIKNIWCTLVYGLVAFAFAKQVIYVIFALHNKHISLRLVTILLWVSPKDITEN